MRHTHSISVTEAREFDHSRKRRVTSEIPEEMFCGTIFRSTIFEFSEIFLFDASFILKCVIAKMNGETGDMWDPGMSGDIVFFSMLT